MRRDNGVETVLREGRIESRPRQLEGVRSSGQVIRIAQVPAGRFRQFEDLLAVEYELCGAMGDVERDEIGQGTHRGVCQAREVLGDLHFELEEQRRELV